MHHSFKNTHLLTRIAVVSLLLVSFGALVTTSTLAYRQPVSNTFMPPFCPLLANGEKNTSCLFIPKAQCDFFVSKEGNDSNAGTEASPFATIQKGVDRLTAGDALCIKGYGDGTTYSGGVALTNKNGTANNWITLGGYEPDKKVVIQGNNYKNGTVSISQSSYIRVIGMEVTRSHTGFTAEISENVDFINLVAHDNWEWGIGVPSNKGGSSRIRMEHSKIFNNIRERYNTETQGGAGAQFNNVTEGAYRYNKLYLNLNEGLDIHKDSNQIIVEDNLFSENSHTAFYVNHSSNILYNRNLTICTGEKPYWADQIIKHGEKDNLGTAITFRNETGNANIDRPYGGNHAVINNIIMGCTSHLIISPQIVANSAVRPMGSHLVAYNTFIDAREGGIGGQKEADFIQLKTQSAYYGDPVVFLNNIFKFDDTRAKLINQASAASINTIIFTSNLTNQAPGFTEGMNVVTLPFEQAYSHTTFLGDSLKPWDMSKAQLDNILKRAKLSNNSPAINSGQQTLPNTVSSEFRTQFLNLYEDYLNEDYFGNVRSNNPDIGAHEFGGVPGPTFTPGPTPTDNPSAATDDWDLDNNDEVNIFDFNIFIKRLLNGNETWAEINSFVEAFRADQE